MSKLKTSALVGLLLGLPFLSACEEDVIVQSEVIRPVKAIQVSDSSNFKQRWFSGRAKAAVEVDLAFRISGPLIEFPVSVGTLVKKDDILAQIDPAPFRADVERYKADVRSAQAELKNAEQDLERQKHLFKNKNVSQARVDKSEAAYGVTKAQVGSAQAALDRIRLDLKYTNLKAPFDGVVVSTYVDNFQDVNAKQAILRLVDSSQIEMVVDIPESLISLVPTVTDVIVTYDAFPNIEIPATIKEVGTEASQSTRTYPVTLSMEQPDGIQILPGMAGKASGKAVDPNVPSAGIIQAPVSAVFSDVDAKESRVWVFDEANAVVKSRVVTTGELTDFGIEILSGLKVGDWLVTAGANSLSENQKVRIIE
ncbi:efflux RND transporter periplasmic adaptor subunit [Kiloniella sp.]|uniref:efflux RND transporter periplasmic adaptor subunit n=1 Tax=Kiloniella sp. TaxID=1938587 RepID=UPI003B0233E8